jgi:hypothetical protein
MDFTPNERRRPGCSDDAIGLSLCGGGAAYFGPCQIISLMGNHGTERKWGRHHHEPAADTSGDPCGPMV